MRTQWALIGIVLIASILAILYGMGVFTPVSEEAAPHGDVTAIIEMNEEGFQPTDVEIVRGEAIRFENTGNEWHWPASNLHPTHELYSAFDPLAPVAPGESWTFTFDKVGTWPYHDHLYSSHRGTITVTAP